MKIYLTLILIYFTTNLFSQTLSCDKIVCINGEEIEAIISDITPDIISYKKCGIDDGPKYSIEKTKVFVINYKKGTKQIITNLDESKKSDSNKFFNNSKNDKFFQMGYVVVVVLTFTFAILFSKKH